MKIFKLQFCFVTDIVCLLKVNLINKSTFNLNTFRNANSVLSWFVMLLLFSILCLMFFLCQGGTRGVIRGFGSGSGNGKYISKKSGLTDFQKIIGLKNFYFFGTDSEKSKNLYIRKKVYFQH